jgi:hypothetical protein
MCFARHELDAASVRARTREPGRRAVPSRHLRGAGPAPWDLRATLTGPSRTITVEPIVVPSREPAPAPDRREAPPEPRPAERPAEEPVPTP